MSVRAAQGKRLGLRVSLFQTISVCQWHECPGCDSPFRFGGRDSAEQWLRRFKADPAAMMDLRRVVDRVGQLSLLSLMTDDLLIDQVAAMIASGRLHVCGQVREKTPAPVAASTLREPARRQAPPPRQPALRPRRQAPAPAPTPTPEYSTFSPGVDAVAVAEIMKDAAQDGFPFCEECTKAQAAQDRASAGPA